MMQYSHIVAPIKKKKNFLFPNCFEVWEDIYTNCKNCLKNKKVICKKKEMRMLCRQFARSGETKESVSNDDGDGNKNGKKGENGFRLA